MEYIATYAYKRFKQRYIGEYEFKNKLYIDDTAKYIIEQEISEKEMVNVIILEIGKK